MARASAGGVRWPRPRGPAAKRASGAARGLSSAQQHGELRSRRKIAGQRGASRIKSMSQVRMRAPFRGQAVMRFEVPDDVLPPDHRARLLPRVVETPQLATFSAGAKSVDGHAGRPLSSTRMLLTLWLYAIATGIGSAREIERRTRSDDAFRWIVGDETVSHSRLSQFRVGHGPALDQLFTDVLG